MAPARLYQKQVTCPYDLRVEYLAGVKCSKVNEAGCMDVFIPQGDKVTTLITFSSHTAFVFDVEAIVSGRIAHTRMAYRNVNDAVFDGWEVEE